MNQAPATNTFDSASAFTHAFKRFAGVTPSAWRAGSNATLWE